MEIGLLPQSEWRVSIQSQGGESKYHLLGYDCLLKAGRNGFIFHTYSYVLAYLRERPPNDEVESITIPSSLVRENANE